MTDPRNLLRVALLGVVLGLTALVVPNAAVSPTQAALVKIQRAHGIDLHEKTIWILAVGSDARPGQDMLRSRGDAIQLIGINTNTGRAAAIGIARDSWVSIPGVGSNRINSALYYGGPQLMGRAVGDFTGITPDYVFVTRFPFFENMVNDIGGITLNNPFRFSDPDLKSDGFKAGKIRLNGYDAMAYARIRKTLANGDFGRSAHQQDVVRAIHRAIVDRADKPGFIAKGVLTVMQHLHTDLPPRELFRIAQALVQVDPKEVTTCVVPGGTATIGGASVVLPDRAAARRYGDDARVDASIPKC